MTKIAICSCLRNEAPYILEWIAYHHNIGVSKFLLYDNESTDLGPALLHSGFKDLDIEIIPWRTVPGVSPQIAAFRHGAARLSGQVDFVANIDLDEFICPVDKESLLGFLSSIPADVAAIAVNQRIFASGGKEEYSADLVLARFTICAAEDYEENRYFKTIARPERVVIINDPHSVHINSGRYVHCDFQDVLTDGHPGRSVRVCEQGLRLNHYITKSREEFLHKRSRGGGAGATAEERQSRYKDMAFFDGRTQACAGSTWNLPVEQLDQLRHRTLSLHLEALLPRAKTSAYDPKSLLDLRYRTDVNFETIIESIYRMIVWPGSIAIDGGAHLGRHTFPLSELVGARGEVVAVEALPNLIDYIRERKHALSVHNIRLVPKAISDYTGSALFNWVKSSAGYSSLEGRPLPFDADVQRLEVDVVQLDSLQFGSRISFIKLDLEGGELAALRGAKDLLAKHRPIIVFENHGSLLARNAGYSMEEWFQFFENCEFSILDLFGRPYSRERWDAIDSPPYCIAYPMENVHFPSLVSNVVNCFWSDLTNQGGELARPEF